MTRALKAKLRRASYHELAAIIESVIDTGIDFVVEIGEKHGEDAALYVESLFRREANRFGDIAVKTRVA